MYRNSERGISSHTTSVCTLLMALSLFRNEVVPIALLALPSSGKECGVHVGQGRVAFLRIFCHRFRSSFGGLWGWWTWAVRISPSPCISSLTRSKSSQRRRGLTTGSRWQLKPIFRIYLFLCRCDVLSGVLWLLLRYLVALISCSSSAIERAKIFFSPHLLKWLCNFRCILKERLYLQGIKITSRLFFHI